MVKVLENVDEWHIDEHGRFVPGSRVLTWSEARFGTVWIGLSPLYSIALFKGLRWIELKMVDENAPVPRYKATVLEVDVNESRFLGTFVVPLLDLELAGNIQVNANVVLITNELEPKQAWFANRDWPATLTGIVQSAIRGKVTGMNFEELKAFTSDSRPGSPFDLMMKGLNGIDMDANGAPHYRGIKTGLIFDILGVAIIAASIQDLEPVGDGAEALEATEVARLQGQAAITTAQLQAEQAVIQAQGKYNAASLNAAAKRIELEQTIGYAAAFPGGERMLVAMEVSKPDSPVNTWAEAKSNTPVTLAFPTSAQPEDQATDSW